ncbi:MAG: hypothetical protein A2351_05790 [Omnitrophica bacterium RIFOXYB12_FULL_50_7]|nr:MAG: hypothetical protein A2351_05790 [Omnitrophica bacterium RIFOXYB12_FULL_50_7]
MALFFSVGSKTTFSSKRFLKTYAPQNHTRIFKTARIIFASEKSFKRNYRFIFEGIRKQKYFLKKVLEK